jgi:hypothetical protein
MKIQIKLAFVLIHWFFPKWWSLDFEKYHELWVFQTFFSLLTDIHLIFGALLCHTKIQTKLEFAFDLLEFHEVMAHGLRKIIRIVSSLHFCSSLLPTGFAVSDTCSYKSKFSLVMLELPGILIEYIYRR